MEVVGEAVDGDEAVALARSSRRTCSCSTSTCRGSRASKRCARIARECPDVQTVVLTVSDEDADVLAGAGGRGLRLSAEGHASRPARRQHPPGGGGAHGALARGGTGVDDARPRSVPTRRRRARRRRRRLRETEDASRSPARGGGPAADRRVPITRRSVGALDQPAHRQAVRDQHLREARGAQPRAGGRLRRARGPGLALEPAARGGRSPGAPRRVVSAPSLATPVEMWRRTVIGESESRSPIWTSRGRSAAGAGSPTRGP